MTRARPFALILLLTVAGCGADDGSNTHVLPNGSGASNGQRRSPDVVVEESDLYQRVGTRLYVQNAHTGLNIVDISNPRTPRLLGRASVVGKAGELYVRGEHAIVVLDTATRACSQLSQSAGYYSWASERSEIALVNVRDARAPRVEARVCIPGTPVGSRLVGNTLYLVARSGQRSRVIVLDVRDPSRVRGVAAQTLDGAGHEVHVTAQALFVAAAVGGGCEPVTPPASPGSGASADEPPPPLPPTTCSSANNTLLTYFAIDGTSGKLDLRGRVTLRGAPQGRFHMNAHRDTFRIVTFDQSSAASVLTVLRFGSGGLSRLGELGGIGRGERLYATRFDGERAYVVTFRQVDPLWVIDLSTPSKPRIVGELTVPGWSDYIFPRGDRLLAVGRGDGGRGFAVSLFDISDVAHPRQLQALQLGSDTSTSSAANTDHRAVTVIDRGDGKLPLLLVPYSEYRWGSSAGPTAPSTAEPTAGAPMTGCTGQHWIQLVDVGNWGLTRRGKVQHEGAVLRTLFVEGTLLGISASELAAIDIANRDAPRRLGVLNLGGNAAAQAAQQACGGGNGGMFLGDDMVGGPMWRCGVGGRDGRTPPLPLSLLVVAGCAALGLVARRCRRRRRR